MESSESEEIEQLTLVIRAVCTGIVRASDCTPSTNARKLQMSTQLYVQVGKAGESMATVAVESKESPMRHHKLNLMWTASGYGKRIPTTRMVKFEGKWRRVYCMIYSNSGTCYIGSGDNRMTVTEG